MTKPADSGQIAAKARELAIGICSELCSGDPLLYCPGKVTKIASQIVAFAESERQSVKEDCCRAVCSYCRDGDVPERRMYSHPPKPFWVHTMIGFDDRTEDCNAGAIYEAAAIRSME
jgi:hypothetical protein